MKKANKKELLVYSTVAIQEAQTSLVVPRWFSWLFIDEETNDDYKEMREYFSKDDFDLISNCFYEEVEYK